MKIPKLSSILFPLMMTGGVVTQTTAQQTQEQVRYVADNDSGNGHDAAVRRADSDNPRTTSTEPLNSCGDSLPAIAGTQSFHRGCVDGEQSPRLPGRTGAREGA